MMLSAQMLETKLALQIEVLRTLYGAETMTISVPEKAAKFYEGILFHFTTHDSGAEGMVIIESTLPPGLGVDSVVDFITLE